MEWTKNSDIPRFPANPSNNNNTGERVNEKGDVVQTERILDLQDVDPGKQNTGVFACFCCCLCVAFL